MSIIRRQQAGMTLIELLIGMLVGLIIVAAGIAVFATSLKGQTDNIKLARLNQDMRAMMDIMERDIRRAGFVTSDPEANWASLQDNPFFDATTDIAVWNYDGGNNNCIVYAYNRDSDNPPTVTGNERMGFRLKQGGKLEMRSSGGTNVSCNNQGDSWETITEPEVEITGLTFTLNSTELNVTSMINDDDGDGIPDGDNDGNGTCDVGEACNTCVRDGSPDPACLYVRNVSITLSGRLRDDNAVTQTITEQVRVRNDKYLAAVP